MADYSSQQTEQQYFVRQIAADLFQTHVLLVTLKTRVSVGQIVILLTELHFNIAGNFSWSQNSLVLSPSLKVQRISMLHDCV